MRREIEYIVKVRPDNEMPGGTQDNHEPVTSIVTLNKISDETFHEIGSYPVTPLRDSDQVYLSFTMSHKDYSILNDDTTVQMRQTETGEIIPTDKVLFQLPIK